MNHDNTIVHVVDVICYTFMQRSNYVLDNTVTVYWPCLIDACAYIIKRSLVKQCRAHYIIMGEGRTQASLHHT